MYNFYVLWTVFMCSHTDGEVLSPEAESETFLLFVVFNTGTTDATGGCCAAHVPVLIATLQNWRRAQEATHHRACTTHKLGCVFRSTGDKLTGVLLIIIVLNLWPPLRTFWLRMNPSQQFSRLQELTQNRWTSARVDALASNTSVRYTPELLLRKLSLSKPFGPAVLNSWPLGKERRVESEWEWERTHTL